MGTFAETTIVHYCLSFADQEKEKSFFRFCSEQTKGSLPFPFSVCRKEKEVAVFR
jgi:hypothetical protein